QSEDRRHCIALWGGEALEAIQHRRAQLVQPAVGELHLRLDADRRGDTPAGCAPGDVVEECALACARVAPKDDDAAAARGCVDQNPLENLALRVTPEERHGRPSLRASSLYACAVGLLRSETSTSDQGAHWCDRPRGPHTLSPIS